MSLKLLFLSVYCIVFVRLNCSLIQQRSVSLTMLIQLEWYWMLLIQVRRYWCLVKAWWWWCQEQWLVWVLAASLPLYSWWGYASEAAVFCAVAGAMLHKVMGVIIGPNTLGWNEGWLSWPVWSDLVTPLPLSPHQSHIPASLLHCFPFYHLMLTSTAFVYVSGGFLRRLQHVYCRTVYSRALSGWTFQGKVVATVSAKCMAWHPGCLNTLLLSIRSN